jgi:hypothetical protein
LPLPGAAPRPEPLLEEDLVMKKRKTTPKPRALTRTELDALTTKILGGDAERLERDLMRAVYGAPTETDVDPLPLPPPLPLPETPGRA